MNKVMVKWKISIKDVSGNLYVIHVESTDMQKAMNSITNSDHFIDVGNNKLLNPKYIVTIRGDAPDA